MRKHYKKADKTSSAFFTAGFFLSKLSHLPFHLVSSLLNLIALALYLVGYLTWLTASLLHPSTTSKKDKWYGFAQFKKQHTISASIGAGASLMGFATLIVNPLLIPCLWLFVVSNIFWSIAEYHKLKNPPEDEENYAHTKQKSYLSYTISTTSISIVIAASTTLTLLIPAIAFFIVPFSFVLSIGLSILAFKFWFDHRFGKHNKENIENSYEKIASNINAELGNEKRSSLMPQNEERASYNLFASHSSKDSSLTLSEIDSPRLGG